MRIAAQQDTVHLHKWETERHLISHLSKCSAGYILLGRELECVREFFSVDVIYGLSDQTAFGVGILHGAHGLPPQLLLASDEPRLIIGYEKEVAAFRLMNRHVAWTLKLESIFHRLVPLSAGILVVEEIGLQMVDGNGHLRWSLIRDIVETATLETEHIVVRFMDSGSARVRLADGHVESLNSGK